MAVWILKIIKHNFFLLIFLWLILTAINIDKAYHIDDPFHIEASQYIRNNPLKPMSGLINWAGELSPIYNYNQPPLFFYLIAIFSSVFGTNEIPLHILLSVFTFLGLYYFYKLTQILSIKNIKTLLILFAFCPALIINQNLMTDVPVLALILGSAYFLFNANYKNKFLNYCISSLLIGLGLLIKYSILPLLIVLLLVILIRRTYKNLIVLLIPILILFLWSSCNYMEYCSVHILDRPTVTTQPYQFLTFIACLGSISAFSISFVFGLFPFKIIKRSVYFVLSIFIISIVLFFYGFISERLYEKYLNYAFIINGLFVFITLFIKLIHELTKKELKKFIISDCFIIFLFIISISAFIILYAPFIATRHILLIIPFILLLKHDIVNKATININKLSISVTIILGLLLGFSDWKYADYYRQMASVVDLPRDRNIWTAGYWGWNWYSKKNGMKQYNIKQSDVKEGDYFVYPGNVALQNIDTESINLIVIDKKWKEANILSLFSGKHFASLYNSFIDKPPWSLSKNPIDTIYICKIEFKK